MTDGHADDDGVGSAMTESSCSAKLMVDMLSVERIISSKLKRLMDVVGSGMAIAMLTPFLLAIVLLIKIESKGPAIFKQTRTGRDGKEFTLYKFRSMRSGSDQEVHKDYVTKLILFDNDPRDERPNGGNGLNEEDLRGDSGCFKLERDQRVTRVGRLLRRASLDELPQFVNVIRGEMSLVGPRPALPYEVDMYETWHTHRLLANPGITGLWQVSGRSRMGFNEMVELDLDYINNWSLILDLKILAKTVPVVFKRQGAW